MAKKIYIWVNGILTRPGDSNNWTGKAVTWCIAEHGLHSEKVEYFTKGFLGRSLMQKTRAKKLEKTLQRYIDNGWEIVLGGHSNGCDVIIDCLKNMNWPKIKELHLISAACEADFNKNFLNDSDGNISRISVYIAGKDKALILAGSWLGRLLGYGVLGKTGPENNKMFVQVVEKKSFGHSTWFNKVNFDNTMGMIT